MATDVFGIAGKRALVVGGGQGIGEAVALAFAGAGSDVVLVDVDSARCEAVAAKVRALGRDAQIVTANVLDDQEASDLVAAAERRAGAIDLLATIVGSTAYRPLLETEIEHWDFEQKLNLRYVFLVGKAFAAARVRTGQPGTATFVSSVSGMMAAPRHAPYGAAKAGLIHLVKTMATEWAPHGIRVNSVAPGPIITPRLPDTPEWREQIERSALPMQRRGRVEEIANAVLFLASEMSSYVTGQTLAVDGGLSTANIMAVPPRLNSAR